MSLIDSYQRWLFLIIASLCSFFCCIIRKCTGSNRSSVTNLGRILRNKTQLTFFLHIAATRYKILHKNVISALVPLVRHSNPVCRIHYYVKLQKSAVCTTVNSSAITTTNSKRVALMALPWRRESLHQFLHIVIILFVPS